MHQARIYLFTGLIMILIQGGYVRKITSGKEFKVALSVSSFDIFNGCYSFKVF